MDAVLHMLARGVLSETATHAAGSHGRTIEQCQCGCMLAERHAASCARWRRRRASSRACPSFVRSLARLAALARCVVGHACAGKAETAAGVPDGAWGTRPPRGACVSLVVCVCVPLLVRVRGGVLCGLVSSRRSRPAPVLVVPCWRRLGAVTAAPPCALVTGGDPASGPSRRRTPKRHAAAQEKTTSTTTGTRSDSR